MGDQLPTGQLSVVPWRRTGVKYTNNEAYFDVIEEIDAIIDKSGRCFYSVLRTIKIERGPFHIMLAIIRIMPHSKSFI